MPRPGYVVAVLVAVLVGGCAGPPTNASPAQICAKRGGVQSLAADSVGGVTAFSCRDGYFYEYSG